MYTLKINNPATGEMIGEVGLTETSEIPVMYDKSRKSFQHWSSLSVRKRVTYLTRVRDYIVDNLEGLSQAIANSTGKVQTEALVADIIPVLDNLEYLIKHAPKVLARQSKPTPLMLTGKKSYVEYMPRGVVLIISPWNYPFQLSLVPMLSSLVAGNSVILKPSEITPLVGQTIEELLAQAGLPQDLVQVAYGAGDIGAKLVDGKPDYIFFTGSVKTGKEIQRKAAQHLIPTTLELGGKDPMLVFSDANLKRAVKAALWGAFTNCGQVCMSIERLYVQEEIYSSFLKELVAEASKLKQACQGHGDIGSMTSLHQVEIVRQQVEEALKEGAKLLFGKTPDKWDLGHGLFVPPIILTNLRPTMRIMQEETFGPVLPVIPFTSEEEAIAQANKSRFGLNASVWTGDRRRAERVANQLKSGGVVINDVIITVANPHLPFGGVKESGLGRYHGESGILTFCQEKAVMLDRGTRPTELQWYPYDNKYANLVQLVCSFYSRRKNWLSILTAYRRLLRRD